MLERAKALAPRLTELRHDFHKNPELGFQEKRTASIVADTLRSLGIRVQTGVGKTGVLGFLGTEGPVVGLRADMDALPIQEANAVEYASQVPGVMHACGHDAHTASLLGAAMLLAKTPPNGQVRFFFQPSEEGPDAENKSGAARMIDDGAMAGVDAIFGIHTDSEQPVGMLRTRPGAVAAGSDRFSALIKGVAAHGASPQAGVDAILLSSQVIGALHTIVSRRIAGPDCGVITVGIIRGGTKENIVADRVEIAGTIRSFDPKVRETLHKEIERCCGVAKAMGGDYEVTIHYGYPTLVNHPELTEWTLGVLGGLVGKEHLGPCNIEMGSEDFSMFANLAPGVFVNLGCRTPGGPIRFGHHPTFDVDDACLPIGAATYAELATKYLEGRPAIKR
jgi:IAA-amino acid hydrolase